MASNLVSKHQLLSSDTRDEMRGYIAGFQLAVTSDMEGVDDGGGFLFHVGCCGERWFFFVYRSVGVEIHCDGWALGTGVMVAL